LFTYYSTKAGVEGQLNNNRTLCV